MPERESIMSSISSKLPRLRLDPVSYETLRQQILRRDGWRCQSCGTMSNLEIHHQQFRRQSGDDSEENLIKQCVDFTDESTSCGNDSVPRSPP